MFQINILENATGHTFDSYFNDQHILRQLTDLISNGQSWLKRCYLCLDLCFNKFIVISNKISRSLHFCLWKLSYKISVQRTPLLTNFLLHRTKILVSSSNFTMDSLKSVKSVIQLFKIGIQNIFVQMRCRFKLHCS